MRAGSVRALGLENHSRSRRQIRSLPEGTGWRMRARGTGAARHRPPPRNRLRRKHRLSQQALSIRIGRLPSGSNSAGRVSASQAECRGFESRLPLHFPFLTDRRRDSARVNRRTAGWGRSGGGGDGTSRPTDRPVRRPWWRHSRSASSADRSVDRAARIRGSRSFRGRTAEPGRTTSPRGGDSPTTRGPRSGDDREPGPRSPARWSRARVPSTRRSGLGTPRAGGSIGFLFGSQWYAVRNSSKSVGGTVQTKALAKGPSSTAYLCSAGAMWPSIVLTRP